MPQNLDFALYFNIAFITILALGLLFGFLRGLKKAMWGFFVTLIFYVIFFLTINQAVNFLWTVNLSFLGGLLGNIDPSLSSVTSLQEALPILLQQYLGDMIPNALSSEHVLAFVTALSLFVVKIAYMIIYFTVIQILYRLILWIVRMIIFPSRKKTDKYRSKNRGLGALFGLMTGVLSLYVTLVIFGGLVSISESLTTAIPQPTAQSLRIIETSRQFPGATDPVGSLAASSNPLDSPEFTDAYNLLNDMVTAFNSNVIVQAQDQITMTSPYDGEPMPLNLYLFDSVLSIDYDSQQIAFRQEIDIYANAAATVLNSTFFETQNYSDITGDDIRSAFNQIAQSKLLTSLIPVAVEVGADYLSQSTELPVDIPVDQIYDIEWDTELMQLGEIAATAFDIINAAGILNDNVNLDTVVLNGDDVATLFDELGQSELVNLAAYTAIEPILVAAGTEVQAFITVPEDINWQTEFSAMGAIASEILNSGLTVGDVKAQDFAAIIGAISDVNFTVLLDSQIVTNALINILEGRTSIDVSFLNIPPDIVWLDTEVNGQMVNGELHNILNAINQLTNSLSGVNVNNLLNNLDLQTIAELDLSAIDSIFESRILVATITEYIRTLPLGDYEIIIPDTALDEYDNILKDELKAIVAAADMALTNLACPVDDTACQELGFNFNGVLSLSGDDIDLMLASEILSASLGNVIVQLGAEELTVPSSALVSIDVNETPLSVVKPEEIKAAFLAISTLGITDINNLQIDTSILANLAVDGDPTTLDTTKADLLFGSVIINATLSQYLISYANEPDAFVIVPYEDQDGNTIRVTDSNDGTEYISQTELTNILKAILAMDIQDINNIETLDLGMILDKASVLLDSAILHATISNQLLALTDVVTVPMNDMQGDPLRITTGPVDHPTTFIAKSELENALDALNVLQITDINNVQVDVSILNNLAVEGSPTVLDTTKADTLFGSTIINATLSKYIIDFTTVDTPFIVVPYFGPADEVIRSTDPADGTEFISQAELTNILKAILAINLQDFDSVETLDLTTLRTNLTTLLDSAILHATVSKQLLDLTDVIVVPTKASDGVTDVKVVVGAGVEETTYIAKAELESAFDALDVLGITDINNVAIDMTILNNLAVDGQPTVLDTNKTDVLFGSTIINATLSKYIIDFTTGDSALIVVPYEDQDGTAIRITDPVDATQFITEAELTNVLKAILVLDIQDFNTVDTLSLQTIIDNSGTLLDSAILHATVSKQIFDLGSDVVTVPYKDETLNAVRVTTGPAGDETEFIVKSELQAMFDALGVLGINDIANFSGTIDFGTILADPANVDTLLASSVIQATISSQVLTLTDAGTGDSLMNVPYLASDGVTAIRVTVGDPGFETEYIVKNEIKAIFDSLDALDITDITTFSGTIDLSLLADSNTQDTVLGSSVIHATISKQLIDLDDGSTIIVPYEEQDGITLVRKTVGIPGQETEYITKDELKAVFDAMDVLGITDVTSFTGNDQLDLSVLAVNNNVDVVLESAMIQAIVSKQVIDLDDVSGTIQVPYMEEDDTTPVRISVDDGDGHTNLYVAKTELRSLILSLDVLGLTDVNTFGGSVDLSLLSDPANKAIVLGSSVIQATISEQLMNTVDGSTFIIPYYEEDTTTPVVIVTGPVGLETTYVSNSEISNLLDALDVLNLTDVTDFSSSSVDFATFAEGNNATVMTSSAIIQAIISKQLIDLDVANTISVPYVADDDTTDIRVTVGPVGHLVELVVKDEIVNAIMALDMLGVTDPTLYTGAIDLTIFYDEASRNILLASSIMQATVSDQVIGLGAVITVPVLRDDNLTEVRRTVGDPGQQTEYILKPEIHAIFESLEVLGMTSIQDFNGTISLNAFLPSVSPATYNANQTTLLNSASIQATISKQILDLQTSGFVVVPSTDIGDQPIEVLVSGTDYIYVNEIKALINAMDLLGVTDITDFDGNVGLGHLFASQDVNYDTNQNTMLASAIMHATISNQISDLDGGAIVLPSFDSGSQTITTVVSTNAYIVKTEIKHLLNAMDLLGFSGDLDNFGGNVDLSKIQSSADQDTLLDSAIMHATITSQLKNLDGGALVIPSQNLSGNAIEEDVLGNAFILKTEIKSLLDAMNVIGISGNLGTFDGAIGLDALFPSKDAGYDTNQNTVLLSAIMHATITDQISGLAGGGNIVLPTTDADGVSIFEVIAPADYILKAEIKHLLDAMDILGFNGNLSGFTGSIGLTPLLPSQDVAYDSHQDTLLASVIMQATMTDQITGMAGIMLPTKDIDGTDVFVTPSGNSFYVKTEIKALINALDVVGFGGDLSGFTGTISLAALANPADQTTLLTSAIMHATLSDKLVNDTNGGLTIPDKDINTNVFVRVTQGGTLFIEKNETKALLTALNAMGLTDYATMDVSPTAIFSADFDTLLASATMQATISENILGGSTDEDSPVLGKLIVPKYFRESIDVETIAQPWIEKVELKNLLVALDTLNINDFTNVSIGGDVFSTMSGGEIDTMLDSGSMHITINYRLTNNASINTTIPNLAYVGEDSATLLYDIAGVVKADEIRKFIIGVQPIGGGDISATIDFAAISGLSQAERDTALDSMIIRCKITADLTTAMALNGTPFAPADYESGSVPAMLTYAKAKYGFDLLYPVA